MYPDSGYKTTHAQSVCTRPFSRGEGPGDEARSVHTRHFRYTAQTGLNCILERDTDGIQALYGNIWRT